MIAAERGSADRDDPLFVPFSEHADDADLQVRVAGFDVAQFASPAGPLA